MSTNLKPDRSYEEVIADFEKAPHPITKRVGNDLLEHLDRLQSSCSRYLAYEGVKNFSFLLSKKIKKVIKNENTPSLPVYIQFYLEKRGYRSPSPTEFFSSTGNMKSMGSANSSFEYFDKANHLIIKVFATSPNEALKSALAIENALSIDRGFVFKNTAVNFWFGEVETEDDFYCYQFDVFFNSQFIHKTFKPEGIKVKDMILIFEGEEYQTVNEKDKPKKDIL